MLRVIVAAFFERLRNRPQDRYARSATEELLISTAADRNAAVSVLDRAWGKAAAQNQHLQQDGESVSTLRIEFIPSGERLAPEAQVIDGDDPRIFEVISTKPATP